MTSVNPPDQFDRFGRFGGRFVPEALMVPLAELTDAYERFVRDNESGFMDDFRKRLGDFGGRPTPLTPAQTLSDRYGTEVLLKREDLLHGGAHKLNNALGQCLLTRYLGKDRVIAETGAGQHGTATAMAAAALDLECEIFMGETDIERQRQNVVRMELLGAEVVPVERGKGTLKEAINESLRDWATSVETTHYVVGSVVGPAPFPAMVRDFQAIISDELTDQLERLPSAVVACAGGGSNAMGAFHHFVEHDSVDLYAVEAGGDPHATKPGIAPHSASLSLGTDGVLHGARTRLLQDEHGQVLESHSVSAGLDYAGVGPELAHLVETGRVTTAAVDDNVALEAFERLPDAEGIIPALETAHAIGFLEVTSADVGDRVVVNVSGRGDKDLETVRDRREGSS